MDTITPFLRILSDGKALDTKDGISVADALVVLERLSAVVRQSLESGVRTQSVMDALINSVFTSASDVTDARVRGIMAASAEALPEDPVATVWMVLGMSAIIDAIASAPEWEVYAMQRGTDGLMRNAIAILRIRAAFIQPLGEMLHGLRSGGGASGALMLRAQPLSSSFPVQSRAYQQFKLAASNPTKSAAFLASASPDFVDAVAVALTAADASVWRSMVADATAAHGNKHDDGHHAHTDAHARLLVMAPQDTYLLPMVSDAMRSECGPEWAPRWGAAVVASGASDGGGDTNNQSWVALWDQFRTVLSQSHIMAALWAERLTPWQLVDMLTSPPPKPDTLTLRFLEALGVPPLTRTASKAAAAAPTTLRPAVSKLIDETATLMRDGDIAPPSGKRGEELLAHVFAAADGGADGVFRQQQQEATANNMVHCAGAQHLLPPDGMDISSGMDGLQWLALQWFMRGVDRAAAEAMITDNATALLDAIRGGLTLPHV